MRVGLERKRDLAGRGDFEGKEDLEGRGNFEVKEDLEERGGPPQEASRGEDASSDGGGT